jgi:hypothetical protein
VKKGEPLFSIDASEFAQTQSDLLNANTRPEMNELALRSPSRVDRLPSVEFADVPTAGVVMLTSTLKRCHQIRIGL